MTAAEFRLRVDREYRAIRHARHRIREWAAEHGVNPRTALSWYYGERPIPDYIERAMRPVRHGSVQLNAAVSLIAAELDRLALHVAAVERMCVACEPDGICHDASCPLRPVSPLRLVARMPA